MRIVLVSTFCHPVALGLRYVSSYLKSAGYDVEMLLMSSQRDTARPDYSQQVLDDFVEHCRGADLIGFSLMTNSFERACFLTEKLKASGIEAPIVWGGTHPTVAPEECLPHADIVCIGEGEKPITNLADRLNAGQDPTSVRSLWFSAGGPLNLAEEVRNPVEPLTDDLDSYPFPDYELEKQWGVHDGHLVPAKPENMRGTLHRLRVESTRGCPFRCTFCNNTTWANTYRSQGPWVRRRSNENLLAEIEHMMQRFDTIESVNIVDDLFFVRDEDEMDAFVEAYQHRINLPLELDAFPNTITERKVASISRLPLELVSMGIQSGSEDTLRNIYKRATPLGKIIECIDLFKKYKIPAEYHYIVTNPYEPDENVIETMRFAADHHRGPAVLRIFPLMFYPGSPLYERARADGTINERDQDAYTATYTGKTQFGRHDYLSVWLRIVLHLRNRGAPRWVTHRLIDGVTNAHVRRVLDRRWFLPASFITYRMTRKLYKVFVYEPFVRPARKFGKKMSYRQKHPEDDLTLPRALSREAATDDALRSLAATSRNVKQGQPASANSTAEPAVRSRQEQN